MEQKEEWFSAWFDSPYYHILYEKRDVDEAVEFIKALQNKLSIPAKAKVLDAACGKGRHAKTLFDLGLQVSAFDLSPSNIEENKTLETEGLDFFVHDLRNPLPKVNHYDAIFNFFTSFGYFDEKIENQKAFYVLANALKKGGILVMDFFNPAHVLANLVKSETIIRKGIKFAIKRWEENGYLYKSIDFEDKGEKFHFLEKVELISKNDFISYASVAGLHLIDLLGDYQLGYFDEKNSPRMIFFWVK
ncbi:class I SAM-dependent methyltransferase [Aquirufa sp. ROCK-SH2]